MLADADILFGKLALGRRCITREDAKRLVQEMTASAQRGQRESLSQTAVRLGYIAPAQAQALTQVLQNGSLICRGTCGRTFKLSGLTPQDTTACPDCRGHLYVARDVATPAQPVVNEGGGGGVTVMDLEFEAVDMGPPSGSPPDPQPAPAPDPGGFGDGDEVAGKTFLDLDLDMPSSGGADPGASSPQPAAPTLNPKLSDQDPGGTMLVEDDFDDALPEEETVAPGGTFVLDAASNPAAAIRAELDVDSVPGGTIMLEPGSVPSDAELESAEKTVEMSGDGFRSSGPAFEPFPIAPGLELLAPIGRGGMGSVYRARRASGEMVAVKVLTAQGAQLPEVLERFRREVKLSGKLDHSNIVDVFEAGLGGPGEHSGNPYFVMGFIPGRDLEAWAQERQRSATEAVGIVLPVCDAIHYANGKGVIHRDLKPGNIVVRAPDDAPIVCDFGLAKVANEAQRLTMTGEIIGTPNFMSPEQASGERRLIGPPTDVYAIGAVLYYLLTGRPPFTGPTSFAVVEKLKLTPLTPPSAMGASLSPALEQVVVKALAKEPVDRYHTAQQLGDALRAAA